MKSDRGANLGWVVNDELAMTQTATSAIFHSSWHLSSSWLVARILPWWVALANAPGRIGSCLRLLHVVRLMTWIRISQRDIAQRHVGRLPIAWSTVGPGLGINVGKIDALSKHVALHRCFRGSYTQTLGQNADEVGTARAMPKQATIAQVLTKSARVSVHWFWGWRAPSKL